MNTIVIYKLQAARFFDKSVLSQKQFSWSKTHSLWNEEPLIIFSMQTRNLSNSVSKSLNKIFWPKKASNVNGTAKSKHQRNQ